MLCLAIYWPLPHRAQNRFLLFASYVFYAAWDWRFLSLIWLSTAVDYWVGRLLDASNDPRHRRRLITTSVVVNLGVLGLFKYAGFFAESLQSLLAALSDAPAVELPTFFTEIVLPVGISFYTFQTLSYTLDIYRRELRAIHDPLDFALFVAFFPQLVAGPIERARRLLPRVTNPRTIDPDRIASGGWLILWGLYKKTVIADHLAVIVDAVYRPGAAPTGGEVLVATYAFAFQIYCDFSGYSDIARGVARWFGFELMVNFRRPYFSRNPAELWQRWHISLSTWLRDYLYISLGGNRRGPRKALRNLMLTMLLGGLWHGAAWTFLVWGAFHGAWLAIHRVLRPRLAILGQRVALLGRVGPALSLAVTFHLVCLAWLFFRAHSVVQAGSLLSALFTNPTFGEASGWIMPMALLLLPLLAVEIVEEKRQVARPFASFPAWLRGVAMAVLVLIIIGFGEDHGGTFVYFQF